MIVQYLLDHLLAVDHVKPRIQLYGKYRLARLVMLSEKITFLVWSRRMAK